MKGRVTNSPWLSKLAAVIITAMAMLSAPYVDARKALGLNSKASLLAAGQTVLGPLGGDQYETGTSFTKICPTGTWVTGISGTTNLQDSIAGVGPITCSNGNMVGGLSGSSGVAGFSDTSLTGYTAVAISGGAYLDKITVFPSGNSYGGEGGDPQGTMRCPAGSVVVGSFGTSRPDVAITLGIVCKLPCNAGYHINSTGMCEDVDECAQQTPPCDLTVSNCVNTAGSFSCMCNPGYQMVEGVCTDIDECADPATCGPNSQCVNNIGNYSCSCNAGFSLVGRICADINECADSATCGPNSKCVNSIGNYSCSCDAGFSLVGGICTDIDECADSAACGPNSKCVNSIGSYSCSCDAGFSLVGGICTDIDECADSACGPNSKCVNSIGSYSCSCDAGFSLVGGICTDIDECADSATCGPNSKCVNSIGNYSCSCDAGFSLVGGICTDIDECADSATCGPNSKCVNSIGNYSCSCDAGFSLVGGICTDIDECADSATCGPNSKCVNSIGNYSCSCDTGFSLVGDACVDIDECLTSNGGCSKYATCINTVGSRQCTCNACFTVGNGIALDQPGGSGCSYSVDAFYKPVEKQPVINKIKAGSAVPLKFSLGCDAGLNILRSGYPRIQSVSCSDAAAIDVVEVAATSAGSNPLHYDAVSKQYNYVWKTPTSGIPGTCAVLQMAFIGDSTAVQMATFKYK